MADIATPPTSAVPERSDLIDAISADALGRVGHATERARLDDGPAPAALVRLCQEYFELGDVMNPLFTMPDLLARPEWQEESEDDRVLLRVIERGQREGTIDASLPAAWLQQVLWSLRYTAWEMARSHDQPKHEALTLCLRTLEKTIAP